MTEPPKGLAEPPKGLAEPPKGLAEPPKGLAELAELDAVFGALAHQSRRTILSVLQARGGEMTSGAIAARFEHSWPTTSQHLRVLEKAGLVTIALRGRERVYHLNAARLQSIAGHWLARFPAAEAANQPDESAYSPPGILMNPHIHPDR